MPVRIVCSHCEHVHTLPERTFDPGTGPTKCPECGDQQFDVRPEGLDWH